MRLFESKTQHYLIIQIIILKVLEFKFKLKRKYKKIMRFNKIFLYGQFFHAEQEGFSRYIISGLRAGRRKGPEHFCFLQSLQASTFVH